MKINVFFALCAILSGSFAVADISRSASVKSNGALVYQGKIVRPDGSVPSGILRMTLKIYSPDPGLCLLWAETQDVTFASGGFSVEVGHSTNRVSGTEGGAAADFKQAFINNSSLTISSASCATGNSYTPAATDDRLLSASIIDSGTSVEIAAIPVKSVPFALQAAEIGGYGLSNLAKISGSGSSVTYTPNEVQTLKDMLGGDINWDLKSRKLTHVADPVANDDAATKGWVTSTIASSISGAGLGTVTNVSGTGPISVSNGTSTPSISIAQATGTTSGYLSSADWTAFNAKQAAGSYLTALTGDVTAAGPGSAAATVAKINGTAVSGVGLANNNLLQNTSGERSPPTAC